MVNLHGKKNIKGFKKQRHFNKKALMGAGVAIIIVLVVLSYISNSVTTISSATSMTIGLNQTKYISLKGSNNVYAVFVKEASNSSSILYMSSMPILAKPILVLPLGLNSAVNVSVNYSSIANMHVSLKTATSDSVTLELTPILVDLGVKPSASVYELQPVPFTQSALYNVSIPVVNKTNPTTTASTTAVTTTIAPTNTGPTNSQIMAKFNSTSLGLLMSNYNILYKSTAACTESTYNADMGVYGHASPLPPNDYANVSQLTPTSVSVGITKLHDQVFSLLYTGHAPSASWTGPILNAEYDYSTNLISNATYEGVWRGLNFTTLNAAYTFQSSIPNACAALIPKPVS